MELDTSLEILRAVESPKSVSKVVARVRRRSKDILGLIAEMEAGGLLERRVVKGSRGRPRSVIHITELGKEYLRIVSRLEMLPLRAESAGFSHAASEGEYAVRLVERGLDPFQLFLELNDYVRAARDVE